jgi:hypothetical protein
MVGAVRYLGVAAQQEAWHCCSPQQQQPQQQQRHLQIQHAGSEVVQPQLLSQRDMQGL